MNQQVLSLGGEGGGIRFGGKRGKRRSGRLEGKGWDKINFREVE